MRPCQNAQHQSERSVAGEHKQREDSALMIETYYTARRREQRFGGCDNMAFLEKYSSCCL